MLLSKDRSKALIGAGLKELVFSIDTLDKKKFNYVRKNADFDIVLKNINDFLEIKKELKSKTPITQVQCINIDQTKKEIKDFVKYWSKTNVNWINIKKPSTRARFVRDKSLLNIISKKNNVKNNPSTLPCFWLWSSLIILSDGKVIPCCTDLNGINVVGNAFKERLIDIWNSKKMMQLRKDQLSGKFTTICKYCPEIVNYEGALKINSKNKSSKQIKFNSHFLINNEK
jgi:radical SAM protein with 4Fe4S-binding SPASM domain